MEPVTLHDIQPTPSPHNSPNTHTHTLFKSHLPSMAHSVHSPSREHNNTSPLDTSTPFLVPCCLRG